MRRGGLSEEWQRGVTGHEQVELLRRVPRETGVHECAGVREPVRRVRRFLRHPIPCFGDARIVTLTCCVEQAEYDSVSGCASPQAAKQLLGLARPITPEERTREAKPMVPAPWLASDEPAVFVGRFRIALSRQERRGELGACI